MGATDVDAFLELAGRRFEWGSRTYVMGILNATPDSFSGDGLADRHTEALHRARWMVAAGVDILDVGGESTRPGALPVDTEEEIRRTRPLIEALAPLGVPISIDTRKAAVAEAALDAGAAFVNDVTALTGDPDMLPLVVERGAAVCLMHMQGLPENMQVDPTYDDVVSEVGSYLAERVAAASAAGLPRERILVDPGIGFGKTLDHNLDLLANLARIRQECGCPVLVGTSRKSFVGRLTGRPIEERIFGTAGSVAAAIARGADVVRVHDVAEMLDVVRVADAILRRRRWG